MSINLWRVGVSSLGVRIFLLIVLPFILNFLLMLLVTFPLDLLSFFLLSACLPLLHLPSVPLPPSGLAPTVSSVASAFPQPPAPPPLPPHFPPAPPSSVSPALGLGASAVRSPVGVSSALPVFPSAPPLSSFSVPPSAVPSQPPALSSFAPPSSVPSWGSLGLRAPAPVAPDPPSPLFRPFAVSEPASVSLASAFAPLPLPQLLALRRGCLRSLVLLRVLQLLHLPRLLRTIPLTLGFWILRLRRLRRSLNPFVLR